MSSVDSIMNFEAFSVKKPQLVHVTVAEDRVLFIMPFEFVLAVSREITSLFATDFPLWE